MNNSNELEPSGLVAEAGTDSQLSYVVSDSNTKLIERLKPFTNYSISVVALGEGSFGRDMEHALLVQTLELG